MLEYCSNVGDLARCYKKQCWQLEDVVRLVTSSFGRRWAPANAGDDRKGLRQMVWEPQIYSFYTKDSYGSLHITKLGNIETM